MTNTTETVTSIDATIAQLEKLKTALTGKSLITIGTASPQQCVQSNEEKEFQEFLIGATDTLLGQSPETKKQSLSSVIARLKKLTTVLSFEGLAQVNLIDLLVCYKASDQLLARVAYAALQEHNIVFSADSKFKLVFEGTALDQYTKLVRPSLRKMLEGAYGDFNEFYMLFSMVRTKLLQLTEATKKTQIKEFFVPTQVVTKRKFKAKVSKEEVEKTRQEAIV